MSAKCEFCGSDNTFHRAGCPERCKYCGNNREFHRMGCPDADGILSQFVTENKELKETIQAQGEECMRRHNLLCKIKEVVDEYFEQSLEGDKDDNI